MVFRMSPRPSSSETDDLQRFKSIGHHPEGFTTLDEARGFIKEQIGWKDFGLVWDWNPEEKEIPATIWDFPVSELSA